MAATPTEDVLDVSDTFKVLFRSWRLVGAWAFGTAIVVGLITLVVPPIYEARMSVLFPRSQAEGGGNLIQLAIDNSSDVQYLAGVVKSHDMRALVAKKADIKVKDVETAMDIDEMPERRQLELAFRSYKSNVALDTMKAVLDRLTQLDERLLFNVSDRVSRDLAGEVAKAKDALNNAQTKLADFQKVAKTVPGRDQDFTGAEYLSRAQSAEADHILAKKRLDIKLAQAKSVGSTLNLNLPTGDTQLAAWRIELLKARVNYDNAKSHYQPTAQQYKDAQQNLEATQKSIRDELQASVASVEKGIDIETSGLIASELITRWVSEDASEKAKVAPEEARTFRLLLSDLKTKDQTYQDLVSAFEQENVRNKVEKLQWSVLDTPYVVEEPINKRYGLNMAAGVIIGGFIGSLVAVRRRRK